MKKLALILALMLIPCTAFGLEMLNDNTMDSITGQQGVAIVADDIEIFMHIDKLAWLDTGGYGITSYYGGVLENYTAGGALAIVNFDMDTLRINAIVSGHTVADTVNGTVVWELGSAGASQIPLQYAYGTANTIADLNASYSGNGFFQTIDFSLENYTNTNLLSSARGGAGQNFAAKAITIDVTSKLPVTSEVFANNTGSHVTVGGVLIGLPTMEINIPLMVFTPAFYSLASYAQLGNSICYNDGQSYGTIYIEGFTMAVLNGWLEIAPLNH